MTVSPSRWAAAFVLVYAAVFALPVIAVTYSVVDGMDDYQLDFNGDSMHFEDLKFAHTDVAIARLGGCRVAADGLQIYGYTYRPPLSQFIPRLQMSVSDLTVEDATITFSGALPRNSNIRFAGVMATMTSKVQSIFIFSGLVLQDNVTLTIESLFATWSSAPGGYVVRMVPAGNGGTGAFDRSGLFLLNNFVKGGAGILVSEGFGSLASSNNSIVAIDYSTCNGCTGPIVDVRQYLLIQSSSIFRMSHTVVNQNPVALLKYLGGVAVKNGSLFLMSDSKVTGNLLSFSPDTTFQVTENSRASFLRLDATATGVVAPAVIPSRDATSHVSSCLSIARVPLNDAASLQKAGLMVDELVSLADKDLTTKACAYSACIPGNRVFPSKEAEECVCVCAPGYQSPSCTAPTDPTLSYEDDDDDNAGTGGSTTVVPAGCTVAHCSKCDQGGKCTLCTPGYRVSNTGRCDRTCTVAYCITCENSEKCTTCKFGYTVSSTGGCDRICTVSNCKSCDKNYKCILCKPGYRLSGAGGCDPASQKPTLSPTTQPPLPPCNVPNCRQCKVGNPKECTWCNAGFTLAPNKGSCYRETAVAGDSCADLPLGFPLLALLTINILL